MNFNRIKKAVYLTITIYIIYALIFSISIFRVYEPIVSAEDSHQTIDRFFGDEVSQDRVVLLDDGSLAASARFDLIDQAEDSIQIAYYSIHSGNMADAFFGTIIEAADRGVQVEILLDGIFHNLRGKMKPTVYAFANHPNIELKYYEPLDLSKPWTWNNRLHDKLIIVDQKYAIIGGRNIGDKYFIQEEQEVGVKDRDVLIINSDEQSLNKSVIYEMQAYFNELWNHDFSKPAIEKLSNRQLQEGKGHSEQLLENLEKLTASYPHIFNQEMNWEQLSISTKKISFIHNPIERMNKDPWVWSEISNLLASVEDSFVIESPYIIPTNSMLYHLENVAVPTKNGTFLTNSISSTPNPLAFSGHIRHSDKITEKRFNLIEYKGPDSVHGKTYIFDNRISMIGSFNLDARSSFLSTESMVVIDSTEFADHLNDAMKNRFLENSLVTDNPHENAGFMKRIFLRTLSYITAFYHHLL